VLEHYVLTVGDVERVAASECRVLQLMHAMRCGTATNCGRTGQRLLLKTQVVGGDDSVIEQIAFSDVRVGGSIDPASSGRPGRRRLGSGGATRRTRPS